MKKHAIPLLLAIALAVTLSFRGCAPATASEDTRVLNEIAEKLGSQLDTLRSWSESNQQSAQVLLEQSNTAMQMAEYDHLKPNADTWDKVEELNEQSLGLLHATSSLWESYGTFSAYLASHKKAEAWQKCLEQKGAYCSFRDALEELDTNTIDAATQAAKSAEESQSVIEDQIAKLESLSFEARGAEGLGAGLDTLSKVNAASASSLINLNNGIYTMIKLQAHETAGRHSVSKAEEAGTKELLTGGRRNVSSPHYELKVSSHVR